VTDEGVDETRLAELLAGVVEGFRDAVGVEGEEIIGLETARFMHPVSHVLTSGGLGQKTVRAEPARRPWPRIPVGPRRGGGAWTS